MWFSSNGWWHPAASRTFHCGLYQCRSSQVICGIHVAVVLQQQLSQFQVPWRHCTPATNYSRGCTCYCYHYYYHKNTHIERDIHLCVCGIYISIYIYIHLYTYIWWIHVWRFQIPNPRDPKNGTLARGLHQRRAAQLRPRVEIRPVGDQQPSHAEVTSEGPGMASMAPGTVENLWKIHGKWMEMDGKWMENGWKLNLPMGIFGVTWSFTFRIAFSFVRYW